MTKGRLQHVAQHYRQQLAAHERQAEQALEQAYKRTLATIQPRLDALYDQMVNAMADGEQIPLSWLYETQRLETLTQFIQGQIDHFGMFSKMTVAQAQMYAAQLGQQAGMGMLNATIPAGINWAFGVPSQDAIAAIVGATQAGSPLADLFAGFGSEAAQKTSDALIAGIIAGDNPRKVAGAIQDALGVSRNRALTISRTEMLRSYRDANLSTYRANSDVVGSWVWTADLSIRTCAACIAMNGTVHSLDEDFGSHVNCRCTPVPKTKSWADILDGTGVDTSGLDDTSIDIPSGSDWLDNQSVATQKAILGAKYDGWSRGDFTLKDTVGHTYSKDWGHSIKEKSLKDLVKK